MFWAGKLIIIDIVGISSCMCERGFVGEGMGGGGGTSYTWAQGELWRLKFETTTSWKLVRCSYHWTIMISFETSLGIVKVYTFVIKFNHLFLVTGCVCYTSDIPFGVIYDMFCKMVNFGPINTTFGTDVYWVQRPQKILWGDWGHTVDVMFIVWQWVWPWNVKGQLSDPMLKTIFGPISSSF